MNFLSSDLDVVGGQWHELTIQAIGTHYVVSWDGTAVIDEQDDTFVAGLVPTRRSEARWPPFRLVRREHALERDNAEMMLTGRSKAGLNFPCRMASAFVGAEFHRNGQLPIGRSEVLQCMAATIKNPREMIELVHFPLGVMLNEENDSFLARFTDLGRCLSVQ